jgi:ketosteroid isomerase-like protein
MQGQSNQPNASSIANLVLASVNAFNGGDVEGAAAYFADDAVVKLVGLPPSEPDTFTGKPAVRAWFESLRATNFTLQLEVQKVEGDAVTSKTLTWSDPTRQLGIAPLEGTEVDVVRDGKIAQVIWTISPESQAKMQAAMVQTQG